MLTIDCILCFFYILEFYLRATSSGSLVVDSLNEAHAIVKRAIVKTTNQLGNISSFSVLDYGEFLSIRIITYQSLLHFEGDRI